MQVDARAGGSKRKAAARLHAGACAEDEVDEDHPDIDMDGMDGLHTVRMPPCIDICRNAPYSQRCALMCTMVAICLVCI